MRNTSSVWCTTSSYSKTSVFVRPQVSEKPRVFKNLHSEESFWKDAFSVTVFTGYVWTVGRTGEKNNNRVWATWTIFVFNRVGVWRPQRHTSTLNSLKCLPRRFQATKKTQNVYFLLFIWWANSYGVFFRLSPSVELLLLFSRLFEKITILFKLVQYLLATSAALFNSFLLK